MVLFSLFHPSFPFINNEFQEIKKIGRFLSLSLSLGRFVRGEIRYTLATRSCPPSEEEEEKEKHIYSRPEMFSKRSCKGNRTFLIHDRCHLLLSAVSLQTRLVFTLADICTQEFRREIIRKMNDTPTLREKSLRHFAARPCACSLAGLKISSRVAVWQPHTGINATPGRQH